MAGPYKITQGALFLGIEDSWGAGSSSLVYVKATNIEFNDLGYGYEPGQDITQQDVEDIGQPVRQPASVGFEMGCHPVRATFPAGAPTDDLHPPALLASAVLGKSIIDGFSLVEAGSTVSALKVAEGDSSEFSVGCSYWTVAASGKVMMFRIKSVTLSPGNPDTLNLLWDLPTAPVVANEIYGSFNVYKGALSDSWNVRWEGLNPKDVRDAKGCQLESFNLAAPPGQFGNFKVSFRSARVDDIDVAEVGGAPSVQVYPYPEKSQALDGGLFLWNGVSLTKFTGGVEIDFGVELSADDGFHFDDPNGIASFVTHKRDVRIKLTPAWDANQQFEDFRDGDLVTVFGWWGIGSKVMGFNAPTGFQVKHPEPTNRNEFWGLSLEFGVAAYGGDTGADDSVNNVFGLAWLAGDDAS